MTTVPAPTSRLGRCQQIFSMTSAATAVRKVISTSGKPPLQQRIGQRDGGVHGVNGDDGHNPAFCDSLKGAIVGHGSSLSCNGAENSQAPLDH